MKPLAKPLLKNPDVSLRSPIQIFHAEYRD